MKNWSLFDKKGRGVWLVENELSFGMGRMFEMVAEQQGLFTDKYEMKVMTDFNDAVFIKVTRNFASWFDDREFAVKVQYGPFDRGIVSACSKMNHSYSSCPQAILKSPTESLCLLDHVAGIGATGIVFKGIKVAFLAAACPLFSFSRSRCRATATPTRISTPDSPSRSEIEPTWPAAPPTAPGAMPRRSRKMPGDGSRSPRSPAGSAAKTPPAMPKSEPAGPSSTPTKRRRRQRRRHDGPRTPTGRPIPTAPGPAPADPAR